MVYSPEQISQIYQHKFAYLLLKEEKNVLTVFLNRPGSKNAFNEILINELAFALSYAHYNNNIRAVVIGAMGDVWCAGADMRSFQGQKDTSGNSTIPVPPNEIVIGDLFQSIHKPCIARVHAPVFAGGFLLVCGCHYVVAPETAFFSLPEVKRGIFPFQVMASLLQIMPSRKALDLCILGKTVDAREAHHLGIVTHLVSEENKLDGTVEMILNKIREHSPAAIRLGLKAFDELRGKKKEEQHTFLYQMLMECVKTEDAQEGIKAFKEKRAPAWKGI